MNDSDVAKLFDIRVLLRLTKNKIKSTAVTKKKLQYCHFHWSATLIRLVGSTSLVVLCTTLNVAFPISYRKENRSMVDITI